MVPGPPELDGGHRQQSVDDQGPESGGGRIGAVPQGEVAAVSVGDVGRTHCYQEGARALQVQ